MNRFYLLNISFPTLLGIALCGCSGEPSSSDVDRAVKATVDAENQQMKKLYGGKLVTNSMLTKVNEVKKIGCSTAQGSSGFNCDVEMDVSAPLVGKQKRIVQMRFVKSSDGWQVTR